jgi:hypothetical protein
MRSETLQFFLHIGARGGDRRFLGKARRIDLQFGRQAFETLTNALQGGSGRGGGSGAGGSDERIRAIRGF